MAGRIDWRHNRLPILAIGLCLIVGGSTLGLWVAGERVGTKTLLTTRIGDHVYRALTPAELTQQLAEQIERLPNLELRVIDPETAAAETIAVARADLGITLSPEDTVAAITDLVQGNRLRAGWYALVSRIRPIAVRARLRLDRVAFAAAVTQLATAINHDEHDATLRFTDGVWQVIASQAGRRLDRDVLEETIVQSFEQLRTDALVLEPLLQPPAITTAEATTLIPEAARRTAAPILLHSGEETTTVTQEQLASWTEVVATTASLRRGAELRLNSANIAAFVTTLADQIRREPVDARVVFDQGSLRITQESQVGRALDEPATLAALTAAFLGAQSRDLTLAVTTLEPAVSSATLANLGLKELIGTATTSYSGSPENRKHNIQTGLSFLTSRALGPEEEFSVVTALGAVDDTTGYLPELVIKENRTTPEYGGGLCQVSTTLFRAVLNAGLRITERQNHSYRVSYYERDVGPGLDATIYLPSPDLKFLNDTPGWILIQGSINEETDAITFDLYGTKDGRRSEISKPEIYDVTNPPDPITLATADLPVGETKQIEKPHTGAKTTVTYKVYRGEELLVDQTFRSTYKAWPARYLVGTGAAEPPSTESGETSP